MNDTKFTPGPWEASIRTGCFSVFPKDATPNCLAGADSEAIVFQSGRSDDRPYNYRLLTDEQEANAHLIAAAPEMYEALVIAQGYLRTCGDCEAGVDYLQEVLAKARGESCPSK